MRRIVFPIGMCAASLLYASSAIAQAPTSQTQVPANGSQPRIYYFDVSGVESQPARIGSQAPLILSLDDQKPLRPQASYEAKPAAAQVRADGDAMSSTPVTTQPADAEPLPLPDLGLAPFWHAPVSPWRSYSFVHTTCLCPQHWDDPWLGYCAQRRQAYHCARSGGACSRYGSDANGPPWCGPTPAWDAGAEVLGPHSFGAPTPLPESDPAKPPYADTPPRRRLPKNELPVPVEAGKQ